MRYPCAVVLIFFTFCTSSDPLTGSQRLCPRPHCQWDHLLLISHHPGLSGLSPGRLAPTSASNIALNRTYMIRGGICLMITVSRVDCVPFTGEVPDFTWSRRTFLWVRCWEDRTPADLCHSWLAWSIQRQRWIWVDWVACCIRWEQLSGLLWSGCLLPAWCRVRGVKLQQEELTYL